MEYNPDLRNRRSLRLKEYDYSQPGAYFVTICVHNRECLFGEIEGDKMKLSLAGQIVDKWWKELPNKFSNMEIDEFVVMPNHFHGIIAIVEGIVGADLRVCPKDKGEHTGSPLHKIIQWFKTMTTYEYIRGVKQGELKPFRGKFWQRNYYEHIIRDEDDLNKIREYIQNNPLGWHLDIENPQAVAKDKQEDKSL